MVADDLFVLLAIDRAGSMSGAGRALGVAHTTIARQIKGLEARFGTRLLESHGKGLKLTSQGHEVVRVAKQFEEDLWRLERRVSPAEGKLTGKIRLTTVDVLAHVYADRFSRFSKENPQVKLELATGTEIVSLTKREADVALRFAEPREDSLVGRVIDRLAFGVYGRKGVVASGDDPGAHPWIIYGGAHCARHTEPWRERHARETAVAGSVATPMIMTSMLRSGMGVGLLPHAIGEGDPDLVCLEADTGIQINVWLLVPEAMRHLAHIRAFMDQF